MMSAGTVAWSPHHGGRNYEHADIDAYCDDFDMTSVTPAITEMRLCRRVRICVGRVRFAERGPNTRRRS